MMQYLAQLGFLPYPHGFLFGMLLVLVLAWTLVIKGIALWRSARNSQKVWFVVLLIVNTLGILELVYLIWFAKQSPVSAPAADSSAPVA